MSHIEKYLSDKEEAAARKAERAALDAEERRDRKWLAVPLLAAFLIWILWTVVGFRLPHLALEWYAKPDVAATKKPDPQPAKQDPAPTPTRAEKAAEFGQSGDLYGGANALFASVAGAFVFWAGYLQSKTLRRTQEALAESRSQAKREQFEATFFVALNLLKDRIRAIHTRPTLRRRLRRSVKTKDQSWVNPVKSGQQALEAFAVAISDGTHHFIGDHGKYTWSTLLAHFNKLYFRRGSDLGPFFRLFEQIFRLIDESGLSKTQRDFFVRLARDEVPDAAVLLFALYGMTYEGREFRRFIIDYRLLENMLMMHVEMYGASRMLGDCYPTRAFRQTLELSAYEIEHDKRMNALTYKDFSLAGGSDIHEPVFADIGEDFTFPTKP